jgi:hypothetical protein
VCHYSVLQPSSKHTIQRVCRLCCCDATNLSLLCLCRKALRLGKFLGNVQHLQTLAYNREASTLTIVSTTGEGIYYFLDQFVWSVPLRCCLARY